MDFRPDMDAHLAAKKRQYTRKKKRLKRLLITILCLTIAAIWILIGTIAYRLMQSAGPDTPAITTDAVVTTDAPPTTTETPAVIVTEPPKTQTVTLNSSDIRSGSLILVSFIRDAEYDFTNGETFIPLYGNKSQSYRIASTALTLHPDTVAAFNEMFDAYYGETGNRDYQITQAARTLDEQTSIYDSYLDTYGVEAGSQLAAAPGYSEHHSGYAVDMNVYTSGGVSYSLGTAGEENPIYNWIYDNAVKYGFVLRFPEGKTNLTGITNEPWHFRYVGKGHSAYMAENDLVLEEYIDLLYNYPYNGKHLEFTYDNIEYEVFYVAFGESEEEKQITLPLESVYTVSGNNIDGVIVTVTK